MEGRGKVSFGGKRNGRRKEGEGKGGEGMETLEGELSIGEGRDHHGFSASLK